MRTAIRSSVVLAWSMAVVGCGGVVEDGDVSAVQEPASPGAPGPTPLPNPCAFYLSGAANKTITMGPGVSSAVTTVTIDEPVPPPSYPTNPFGSCTAWVVDVNVPYNSSPNPMDCGVSGCYEWVEINAGAAQFPGSVQVEGGFYVPNNSGEEHCESFINWMAIYKKAAGTTVFNKVTSFYYRGLWQTGQCIVKSGTSYYPNDLLAPIPPDSGTDTYRILTSVKVDDVYRTVRVKGDYEMLNPDER